MAEPEKYHCVEVHFPMADGSHVIFSAAEVDALGGLHSAAEAARRLFLERPDLLSPSASTPPR